MRLSAALLLTVGCRDTGGPRQRADSGCPPDAIASVLASTIDGLGEPVVPDAVSWSVDGGPTLAAECAARPCTQWVAGWEVVGQITVVATLDGEEASATVNVGMDDSGCHVERQDVQLVLP